MKNKEVGEKVRDILSKNKEVLAIFNNGSSIVGMDSPESDLDFVIVTKSPENKKKILSILRKEFEIYINKEDPEIKVEEQYDILGKRTDFTFITKRKMDKKVNDFYKSSANYLELQHFIKHKIVDSIVLYDPHKLLTRWQKKVKSHPKRIMEEVFKSQIYSIKENLYYWKHHGFRNEFQFGFEYWDVIKAICQALYSKNNRLFMLPYKRVHKDLKELKPNIEKEMYKLLRGKNTPKKIKQKTKIVEKILKKLEG